MSKVITFSRVFPAYHPRAGEPTYFVEQLWNTLYDEPDEALYSHDLSGIWSVYKEIHNTIGTKFHTIRAGKRWKVGDFYSPRIWSGKPYNSKQIIIGPDIEIKKLWDFEMDMCGVSSISKPGEQLTYTMCLNETLDESIAKNDGLTDIDFYYWFSRSPDFKKNEGFSGQIICHDENIEYL